MLKVLGHSVRECKDGKEAVELYQEQWENIDLVFLDINMPIMDGEEAFAEMLKINPELIVLISSGYSNTKKAQNILDRGAAGFIQKPFRLNELSEKITEVIKVKD